MSEHNVFIESFVEKIPFRLLPLSSTDEIAVALEEVNNTNSLYVTENQEPKVDPDWLMATTLDFMDWFHAHTPELPEYIAYRKFEDNQFVKQCLTFSTLERIELFHDRNNTFEGPTEKQLLNARLIADALTATPAALTISYSTQSDEGDSFYIPACQYEEIVDHELADVMTEDDDIEPSPRLLFWTLCFHMALSCLMDGFGAITLCVHDEDSVSIGGLAILNDQSWTIVGDSIAKTCFTVMGDDVEQFIDMAHSIPKHKLEAEARIIAASLISSMTATVEAANEYMLDNDIEEFSVFSINPFASAVDFEDNANVYIVPPEVTELPLPDLFDAIIDLDPFFTGTDASECVYAATMARAASDLIENGNMDKTMTEISEFSSFVALDSNNRPFDHGILYALEQAESYRDEERTLEMMGDMYKDLDEQRKHEVDLIVDAIVKDHDLVKNVLILEEENDTGDNTTKAQSIYVPPMHTPALVSENQHRIKAFCTKCAFSKSMTMFIARKTNDVRPNFISGIKWSNGAWKDLGMDKTLEFLETSNIGDFLDLSPVEPLDYMTIDHPML